MTPDPTAGPAGLDWPVVLEAWAEHAMTPLGRAAVRACDPLPDADAVRIAHDEVEEWLFVRDSRVDTGLGAVLDIRADTDRAARGEVLDDEELRRAGSALVGLEQLGRALDKTGEDTPRLTRVTSVIDLDPDVLQMLTSAWDPTGQLSAKQWPVLGELREQIAGLHERVRRTLDTLVSSDTLGEALQDQFWTQRERRYVIPLKHHAKGLKLGIVHGTSRTGQTVFVEPHEVIELNNALRVAEGQLAAEEHRIRALLSRALGTLKTPVGIALDAAAHVDLAAARAGLAQRLEMSRPGVGSEGAIALKLARHPVLALRGVEVIPNHLTLSADQACLVISGPNAGGKTVALKTVGLCALLVQHGCWVPAQEGSRVDHFDRVFSAIGDQQTVEGDLSSFSGHLVTLNRILGEAGAGTLALLDELASGTDPAQGAAMAQAVLEALLDRGARLVVTTHYARLKGLAAVDDRFEMAATEYVDGNPTYRLVTGTTGESRAFDLAQRMGMESGILSRARALMDPGEKELATALEALEVERAKAERQAAELARLREEAATREARLATREAKIKARSKELEARGAEDYLDRLKQADKAIGQVVAELQRNPSHAGFRAARSAVKALEGLVPDTEEQPPPEAVSETDQELARGDRVRLLALNQEAEVIDAKPRSVKVRAGGLTLTVKPSEVERIGGPVAPTKPRNRAPKRAPVVRSLDDAVRHGGNTLDLRGKRLDESQNEVEKFFDRCVLNGAESAFLLHGHGTGALKKGLRSWLPSCSYVAEWGPASEEQGGDAFTVIRLA